MEQRPRFFFVHLQKTAGTALFRRLRHHFGSDGVYPRPSEQGTPATVLDIELLRRRLDVGGRQIQVITGHFPLATVDLLGGPMSTFTVLRDPVERILSFLRHQREVEPAFAGKSLEAIYADPISTGPLVRDHMVRMLSIRAEEMTDGALTPLDIDDGRVELACRNLAERIDVIGLQEHFDTFCSDLEATFGWDLGDPAHMNRTQAAHAPDGLREQIAVDNAADQQLYRFAVELWHRRRTLDAS